MTAATGFHFVLVHGAWHGGWCWDAVADRLRQDRHTVLTPTLPGLAERYSPGDSTIDLERFIQEICELLQEQDRHDVVLVGHSFAGLVLAGVADRLAERIRQLIFLDAFLLPSGQSVFDTLPPDLVLKLEQRAADLGGLAPPPADKLGLTDAAMIQAVQSRLTPHPIGTYRQALQLHHPLGNGLAATYLRCTQPLFAAVSGSYEWARQLQGERWDWQDLACGHDGMISAPALVAQALVTAVLAKR